MLKTLNKLSTGLAMLFFMGLLSVMPAYAATGTLYAHEVTVPAGQVWMGGHLWVSDKVQGFCRLDMQPGKDDFIINPGTCSIAAASPGQPSFDGSQFVYVPDSSTVSKGVWRLTFDPAAQTVGDAVLLAPNAGLGKLRPTSTALGPDGKLYVGSLKTNDINRIANPGSNPALQTVDKFGSSMRVGVLGLTFAGNDLYLAEGVAVTKIGRAGGNAVATSIMVQAPTAITSDNRDVLFIADTPTADSAILRFTISANTHEIFANTGIDLAIMTPFRFVRGLSLSPAGNLFIGDDPTDGAMVMRGHVWTIAAGLAPLPSNPLAPAMKQGTMYASGITDPEGHVWMGSHLWVSDQAMGFCRIDAQPGGFAINSGTCSRAALSPSQPAFDAATNFVYVPDNSGRSRGVWRLTFDPVTQTVSNPVLLAPDAGLGGRRPTATALGADGKLYIGFSKSGDIVRITDPGGDPLLQKEEKFGQSSDGRTVYGLAFVGSDLYLAETTAVTRIVGGIAIPAPITATEPRAITSDGSDWIFVADTHAEKSKILRFSVSANIQDIYANEGVFPDGTTTPFKFVPGLVLDPMGTLFISDDPTRGAQPAQGRMWRVASAFDRYREAGVTISKQPTISTFALTSALPVDRREPEPERMDFGFIFGIFGVIAIVVAVYIEREKIFKK